MILFALVATLCGFAMLIAIFSGVGLLIARAAGVRARVAEERLLLPWIGAAGVIAILQLWHLAFPVNFPAFGLLAVVSAVGWVVGRGLWIEDPLPSRVPGYREREGAGWFICAALLIWLADRSIAACSFGDSGLYHLSATKWIETFHIVPGLANLHGRLGFNNSSFLVHAMVDSVVGFGRSAHFVNGAYLAMLSLIVAWGFAQLVYGGRRDHKSAIFAATMLAVVVRFAASTDISSLSTDLPATVFAIVGGWRLFALTLNHSQNKPLDRLTVITVLSTAATIKLSVLVLAFCSITLVLAMQGHHAWKDRATRVGVACAIVLIGTWMFRGYVLSGYPLYPSTLGGISAEWSAPVQQLVAERENIKRFAKTTQNNRDADLTSLKWVVPWLVQIILLRGFVETVLPGLLFVAGMAYVFTRRRVLATPLFWRRVLAFTSVLAAALWLWFNSAPATRMAIHLWWMLGALGLSLAFWDTSRRRWLAAGLLAIGLVPAVYAFALVQFRWRHDPWSSYYGKSGFSVLWSTGGADHGFEPLPTSEYVERRTASGLTVYETLHGRGFDVPLVSTPDFDPSLRLRDKNNLGSGFSKASR